MVIDNRLAFSYTLPISGNVRVINHFKDCSRLIKKFPGKLCGRLGGKTSSARANHQIELPGINVIVSLVGGL